jgi:hypothetical protein
MVSKHHSFPSSLAPRRYKTLLHLIKTSPRLPVQFPSIYSSVSASCRFMYASTETRNPLYSIPHLSFTMTGFPVSSFKKGLGFTGIVCKQSTHKMNTYLRRCKHTAVSVMHVYITHRCHLQKANTHDAKEREKMLKAFLI